MKSIIFNKDGVFTPYSVAPSLAADNVLARLLEVGVIPQDTPHFIVDSAAVASPFPDARVMDETNGTVTTDLVKAKALAHTQRRAERSTVLEPLDRQATYDLAGAEPLRQVIRDADSAKQVGIDNAITIDELVKAVG